MNKKLTREQRVIKLLDKLQIYEKGYVVHKHTMLKSSYVAGLIMKELTANTEDEPNIKEACLENWHNEKNAWAYVECDCEHCKEARKTIALWKIEEVSLAMRDNAEFSMSEWSGIQALVDRLQQEDKDE